MTTTVTETIKSSGGNYTTWAAWEAATDNDLVAADEIRVGEIYDVNAAAIFTVAGATTDSTRYRKLTTVAANKHAGVWDTGKSNLQASATASGVFILSEGFSRAEYIQAKNTNAAGSGVFQIDAATGVRIEQFIAWETGDDGGDTSAGVNVSGVSTNFLLRNGACYNCQNGIWIGNSGSTGGEIDNCATVANSAGINSVSGVTVTVKNHYSGGNTNSDYLQAGSSDVAYTFTTSMASDSNSVESGLTNNIAYSTANFTNVTPGSVDLHLPSGSALMAAGTDLSGTFNIDINGDARSVPWSVGPDHLTLPPPVTPIRVVQSGLRW